MDIIENNRTDAASVNGEDHTPVLKDLVIVIKGAGEMATGVACRLFNANFRHVVMLETNMPMAVRRCVSFCEAVYDGAVTVEGITARKADAPLDIPRIWQAGEVPVLVDPSGTVIPDLTPHVVIDAIIAKKNVGTDMAEAPLVIGLGPGFSAGMDVHQVIETNRGHNLGRIIFRGMAQADTGIPGAICGVSADRVLRATCAGVFESSITIGDLVKKDEILGHVDGISVKAKIDGMIRGLIRNRTRVPAGCKIGDIDPRGAAAVHDTISEKARAVGGAVLEAVLNRYNQ
ncbi:MAG: selenium-dependent molybdenum cofactor biosynthesis protein YqeB [Desulfotignum sp.]|nr:EF2563 family selenium-dependent molybdenum hydroxylase system protein [Desulfobacteraceae bacterium]